MGLAAKRKRVKLSHDPNNTKWTRDTEGFGHRTLAAQGWQPGDLLGATSLGYNGLRTAANGSHIRVAMKDDNLGLGAKRGSGLAEGECTGLYVFQSLLGRLNGKGEDELAKEQKSREALKTTIYSGQRLGTVRFVKGGFLIGDKMEGLVEEKDASENQTPTELAPQSMTVLAESTSEGVPASSGKGKREDRAEVKGSPKPIPKDSGPRRISKHLSQSSSHGISVQAVEGVSKRSKKRQKPPADLSRALDAPLPAVLDDKRKVKKKRKEKREHREPRVKSPPATLVAPDASNTPQAVLRGLHALRSRNIAQKRLSVLDTASLNQIFMIKES